MSCGCQHALQDAGDPWYFNPLYLGGVVTLALGALVAGIVAVNRERPGFSAPARRPRRRR